MLTAHILETVAALPAPSAPPTAPAITGVNTAGILSWGSIYIVPLLIAVVGVFIITRAKGGHVSQSVTSTGITLLGVVVLGSAPVFAMFGPYLVDLLIAK